MCVCVPCDYVSDRTSSRLIGKCISRSKVPKRLRPTTRIKSILKSRRQWEKRVTLRSPLRRENRMNFSSKCFVQYLHDAYRSYSRASSFPSFILFLYHSLVLFTSVVWNLVERQGWKSVHCVHTYTIYLYIYIHYYLCMYTIYTKRVFIVCVCITVSRVCTSVPRACARSCMFVCVALSLRNRL